MMSRALGAHLEPWSDTAWYFLRVDDSGPVRIETDPVLAWGRGRRAGRDRLPPVPRTGAGDHHPIGTQFLRGGLRPEPDPHHSLPSARHHQRPRFGWRSGSWAVRLGLASPYDGEPWRQHMDHPAARHGSPDLRQPSASARASWNGPRLPSWSRSASRSTPRYPTPRVGSTTCASAGPEADMSGSSQQEFVRAAEAAQDALWNGRSGAQSVQRVWDVTDPQAPRAIPARSGGRRLVLSGGVRLTSGASGRARAVGSTRRFRLAPCRTLTSTACRKWTLSSLPCPLRAPADSLARIHQAEGLDVAVLEPSFIYDCFSSGRVDPTAFKMLMKMLYDRADGNPALEAALPAALRRRHLPQSQPAPSSATCSSPSKAPRATRPPRAMSRTITSASCRDVASERLTDTLAIGIGRIPAGPRGGGVGRRGQGGGLLQRQPRPRRGRLHGLWPARRRGGNPFGPWRNRMCFVADDFDGSGGATETGHTLYSIGHAQGVEEDHGAFDIQRIFMDAYPRWRRQVGSGIPRWRRPSTERCADGALLVNYIGHGGERGWAHERVLNTSTIGAWDNLDRMPLFFTATCELARFDDPELETAGEMMVMNADGGAIAMMTTTRVVYSYANEQLNTAFFAVVFDSPAGRAATIGRHPAPHQESSVLRGVFQQAEFHPARRCGPAIRYAPLGSPHQLSMASRRCLGDTLRALDHVMVEGIRLRCGGKCPDRFQWLRLSHRVRPAVRGDDAEQRRGQWWGHLREWRNRIHTGPCAPRAACFPLNSSCPRTSRTSRRPAASATMPWTATSMPMATQKRCSSAGQRGCGAG